VGKDNHSRKQGCCLLGLCNYTTEGTVVFWNDNLLHVRAKAYDKCLAEYFSCSILAPWICCLAT
jgi:hypothetical protein